MFGNRSRVGFDNLRRLLRPVEETNLGNYKLNVTGSAEDIQLAWSKVRLEIEEDSLDWGP